MTIPMTKRGRPARHDFQVLVAVGLRVMIWDVTLEEAVYAVNKTHESTSSPLCARTLRKRIRKLMKTTWVDKMECMDAYHRCLFATPREFAVSVSDAVFKAMAYVLDEMTIYD